MTGGKRQLTTRRIALTTGVGELTTSTLNCRQETYSLDNPQSRIDSWQSGICNEKLRAMGNMPWRKNNTQDGQELTTEQVVRTIEWRIDKEPANGRQGSQFQEGQQATYRKHWGRESRSILSDDAVPSFISIEDKAGKTGWRMQV